MYLYKYRKLTSNINIKIQNQYNYTHPSVFLNKYKVKRFSKNEQNFLFIKKISRVTWNTLACHLLLGTYFTSSRTLQLFLINPINDENQMYIPLHKIFEFKLRVKTSRHRFDTIYTIIRILK